MGAVWSGSILFAILSASFGHVSFWHCSILKAYLKGNYSTSLGYPYSDKVKKIKHIFCFMEKQPYAKS